MHSNTTTSRTTALRRTIGLLSGLALLALGQDANAQAAYQNAPDQQIISPAPDADSACPNCAQPYAQVALVPPAGFDPVAASDAQLDAYGFPPRPDATKAPGPYALWKTVVTRPVTRIVPQLQATKAVNGPEKMAAEGQRLANGSVGATSGNWSGYVVTAGSDPFKADKTYIFASFTVPVAQQAFGRCSSSAVHASEWIGIDGSGSADVLQAGIKTSATCKSGKTTGSYVAWYEWFPEDEIDIKNFHIYPGDVIYVYVWNKSSTEGHYFLEDVTTNKSSSLSFKAPKGTHLVGNSAEWIVERPSIGGKDATLANYVAQAWLACHVLLHDGTVYSSADVNGGNSESLTMTDDKKDISFADTTANDGLTYVNPNGNTSFWTGTGLWFFDEGPALSSK
jgi:Peptidase A4 family